MKNKYISSSFEEAKTYRSYYRPSFNVWLLFKSVLALLISGSSPVAGHHRRK
ncbi:MAG TPA: hypothetical protein PKC69_09915 [Chitinophagaceae bacterium]|nr:hypothetical protein [Chitinophagaceae bacterium]